MGFLLPQSFASIFPAAAAFCQFDRACVAMNSMEGFHSWTPKTRGVAQRIAGVVCLFQVCLVAEEQNYRNELAEQDLLG